MCHEVNAAPASTSTATNDDSGGKLFVDALLFPANESAPRIVKVEYVVDINDEEPFQGSPIYRLMLKPWGIDSEESWPVLTNGRNGPLLQHSILVKWRSRFLVDGSPINQCIRTLTNGSHHPWAGNILAFKEEVDWQYNMTYLNMTMSDLPPLVAYFKEYGS